MPSPKKIFTTFLLVVVITVSTITPFSPYQPRSAHAATAAFEINPIETIASIGEKLKEWGLDGLVRVVARRLLFSLADSTVQWIQNGGDHRFVTNWKREIIIAADQGTGIFLEELGLTDLCKPFGGFLRQSYQRQARLYPNYASCTLSKVIDNIGAFQSDFRNGGWAAWDSWIQPNNNLWGAIILADDQLLRERATAIDSAEKTAATGFRGDIACILMGNDGRTCLKEFIRTPGQTISDTLSKQLDSDREQIVNADEINEIVIAIGSAMISRILSGGLAGSILTEVTCPPGTSVDASGSCATNVEAPLPPDYGNPGDCPNGSTVRCVEFDQRECIEWDTTCIPGDDGGGEQLDADGDGVPDSIDQCPGTPAGTPVDAVGCSTSGSSDSDNDGVPDSIDQCPNTPPGTVVDPLGCPIPQGVGFDAGDKAMLLDIARTVRADNAVMFDACAAFPGGSSNPGCRSIAYDIMTIVIQQCRAGGTDCQRCIAGSGGGRPLSDPFRYCSDAIWVGAPSGGCEIDLYISFPNPATPNTLNEGCGKAPGGLQDI